ncbi:hypothetical protein NBRC10512_006813 [Rhodotorula toruloides]|uniref:RHTO0S05e04016g1_1 n=2 Tax=Rhodotorula toruloides TaxID=5286 RepID=A0A061ATL5_RHOTO|nr:aromatic amino acid aminotransferase I [Rhodotorula toruloides NP11]KAJ8294261.1 Aromatic amino acid aminotransferase C56E4.03 [Rhodotorula toruloides]EMS23975.1 aromatic amino acid aminotransferase I [Rhodotorula toruloides NP11]KAJ8294262.1 Aromatic amino acid aminotransferase C56E4.03 [Rhodotorula toruloides]KAJ8294263.1 Aromatic amino acid aminotransferase C56E4.03 [Rhodotorula toruloides]CDR40482.1 RHTO0S05e04016g1_1 [Rhodotorula toruloides]
MTVAALPPARDLSHHLNDIAKNRFPSPLKDIFNYMDRPGMISMAGGLPHPSLFPFNELALQVYPPSTDLSEGVPPLGEQTSLTIPKYPSAKTDTSLTSILQYGDCSGNPALRAFLHQFTLDLYQPAYSDFQILLHEGNTSGWTKVVRLLLEPNDWVLCEEFTFPSSMSVWVPMGCKAVPIKMDGEGMRADHLEEVLASWETTHPGTRRPHVMYIVPVGQNPSGSTMPAGRRKEIYDLCVKYDIIICEDDPYTTLQYPPFEISDTPSPVTPKSGADFAASLVPSFLKFDYEGRVIRLESFSKTIAPGNRLGYFVANPLFTERLLRATEVESQTPSGWSQGIILQLLTTWGQAGYLTWLSRLRDTYQTRRDTMCANLAKVFKALPAATYASDVPGAEGIALYPSSTDSAQIKPDQLPVASFTAPVGGMFLWIKFYLKGAPRYGELVAQGVEDPEKSFMDEFWTALADNLVLLTPGSYYTPWEGAHKLSTSARGAERDVGYMRFAFSYNSSDEMEEGIRRVEQVVKKLWAY